MMETRYDAVLQESLLYKKLDCGLEVYMLQKPGYQKKHAFFTTKYGALYNDFRIVGGEAYTMPLGIAHFLEHKIFESADVNIFEEFSKRGAQVNAYTNFQATSYMFSTVDDFDECLALLLDFVQSPYLTPENVEKEKGIIEQEIKMYDDEPEWVGYFSLLGALYRNHPIRYDIAGTVESIHAITVEQLQTCYEAFYTPNNMSVFVIGDLEPAQVLQVIEQALKPDFVARQHRVEILLPEEPDEIAESLVVHDFPVALPIFNVGFKGVEHGESPRERLKISLAMKVALDIVFGKGSEFYRRHYETGLINAGFAYEYSYGRTYAYTVFAGESLKGDEAIQYIIEEIQAWQAAGFEETAVAPILKKLIGRHISTYNALKSVANLFVSYYAKDANLFDYLSCVSELTPEYITRCFREAVDPTRYARSLIRPVAKNEGEVSADV